MTIRPRVTVRSGNPSGRDDNQNGWNIKQNDRDAIPATLNLAHQIDRGATLIVAGVPSLNGWGTDQTDVNCHSGWRECLPPNYYTRECM